MSSVISVAKINDPYISPQRHDKQGLNHCYTLMDLCLIHWNSPPCTSPTSLWMFVGTTDGTDITDTLCFCWDHKLVHSISIHFIRVICGGSIRDEKWYIPADFSTLNHERLQIAQYTKNTMDTFPLCEPAAFFMRIRTTARRCDAARACWPYRNKCWSRAFRLRNAEASTHIAMPVMNRRDFTADWPCR